MITEHAVYRNGWQMVKIHGDKAETEALKYAEKLKERGDQEGASMWSRTAAAIADIQGAIPVATP